MKTSQYQNKGNLIGVVGALLLVSSELTAQTISWGPNATAVPISSTSIAIMAVLFMIGGIWVLSKTQKKTQSFLVMALLMTGLYNFATVSQADDSPDISITSESGTKNLNHGTTSIRNDTEDITVKITTIVEHECTYNPSASSCNVGTELAPGQSCMVRLEECSEG